MNLIDDVIRLIAEKVYLLSPRTYLQLRRVNKRYHTLLPAKKVDLPVFDFVKGKRVSEFKHKLENEIQIRFDGVGPYLCLEASADCCDENWFESMKGDLTITGTEILGKEIVKIETADQIELESSDRGNHNDCDVNTVIVISFTDVSEFKFVWRNASNGYYRGSFWVGVWDEEYRGPTRSN